MKRTIQHHQRQSRRRSTPPPRLRPRSLLYLGLLMLAGGALYVRARLHGPPSHLEPLSLPALESRAAREPHNHGLQLELGVRYAKMGRQAEAEAALDRCLALDPETTEAYAYLGTLYARRRDARKAAQMFQRAVTSDPDFAPGYLELTRLYEKLHHYRRARVAADRYVRLKPDDWEGHYQRGLIYFLDGEIDTALESYARAVRLAPERSAGYVAAGLASLFRPATPAHLAEAAAWFERGLKVDPGSANLRYYAGLTRFRQRKWEQAAAALKQAVDRDPRLTEAYYPLGQALRKLGRSEEARRYLARFDQLHLADRQRAAERMRQSLIREIEPSHGGR